MSENKHEMTPETRVKIAETTAKKKVARTAIHNAIRERGLLEQLQGVLSPEMIENLKLAVSYKQKDTTGGVNRKSLVKKVFAFMREHGTVSELEVFKTFKLGTAEMAKLGKSLAKSEDYKGVLIHNENNETWTLVVDETAPEPVGTEQEQQSENN